MQTFAEAQKYSAKKLRVTKERPITLWQQAAIDANLYLASQPNWDLNVKNLLFAKARRFGERVFMRKFQEYKARHDGKGSRYFLAMFREKEREEKN